MNPYKETLLSQWRVTNSHCCGRNKFSLPLALGIYNIQRNIWILMPKPSNEVLTARCCPYFFRVGICASDLDTVLPTRKWSTIQKSSLIYAVYLSPLAVPFPLYAGWIICLEGEGWGRRESQ